MLQEDQRTSAPRSTKVSIKTAVWIVMWIQPMILAPAKGCAALYLVRNAISAGISPSAISISMRPQSASA